MKKETTETTEKKTTKKTTKTASSTKTTAKKTTTTKTATKKTEVKKADKKRLIVSYGRLPEDAMAAFNEMYVGDSYKDHMQKQEIPGRPPLYLVPFETEDTIYMVKVEVTIDDHISDEDLDKQFDNSGEDSDISLDSDKGQKPFELVHGGDYADMERAVEAQATRDMTEEQVMDFGDEDLDTDL
ncbi:MAG: hypothetical protein KBT03_13265 [Bacteroidales bacterium]|nr:hypothetical protein [Candidatus Scybalousia scybalohippi]